MMPTVALFGAIGLVVIVVLGLLFLVGIVFLVISLTKKKTGSPSQIMEQESAVNNTLKIPSPEEKKEILEMLANKEISKEEAENRLQGN